MKNIGSWLIMNREQRELLIIIVWVILFFLIWYFVPGCQTKRQLPEDCLNEDNWHFIDICKSKDTICFETELEGECFDNWKE